MKSMSAILLAASTMTGAAALAHDHGGDHGDGSAPEVATVEMRKVTDTGTAESLGSVIVRKTEYGLVFEPSLAGLSPGLHGFHLHENGSCKPSKKDGKVTPGGAAGGHYDPHSTGHHDAPWGQGHTGDLPALYVANDGTASRPVLAPRLEEKDLEGRALMIHAGGDNYSDKPKPLGGGGARVACGMFKK